MPERRPRLRRVAYLSAVALSVGAFALSLTSIARTEGRIQPDGNAATLIKQVQQQDHRPCHKPPVSTQREV
jgi:hypothetical protein